MDYRIVFCTPSGMDGREVFAGDGSVFRLSGGGTKAPSELSANTKSSLTVVGQTADGTVSYVSKRGGMIANAVRVEHEIGETGEGHEDRALAVSQAGLNVTVVFGTDESGDSVTPTANQVVAAVEAADADDSLRVTASAGGDGTGLVSAQGLEPLTGGADDGDLVILDNVLSRTFRAGSIEEYTP